MHGKEGDPKAAARLLAYMHRKQGRSIRAICGMPGEPYSTVRGWPVRAVQVGVSGRHGIRNKGAPAKLDPAQTGQLRADLVAGPGECGSGSCTWTAPLIIGHVRKRFGVRIPPPEPASSCTGWGSRAAGRAQGTQNRPRNQRKTRLKKVRRIVRDNPGHRVMAADEASFIIGRDAKNGWYPKGRPVTTPVSLSRKRFYSLGALHGGGLGCRFYERASSYSFAGMPGHLHRRYGRIIVLVDNAGYHKSRMVREFVDSYREGGGRSYRRSSCRTPWS